MHPHSSALTTWIAAFIGWAVVTAAFLTLPPLRRLLPIDGSAAPPIAATILAEKDSAARLARIAGVPEALGERAAAELADVATRAHDAATRQAAIRALARAPGGIAVLAGLGLKDEFRVPVLETLAKAESPLASRAILDLLPACRTGSERSAAFLGLALHGGLAAIDALLGFATAAGATGRDRATAIRAIAEIRDPDAAPGLWPWLRAGQSDALNEAILKVLGRLRDPRAAPAVARFLEFSESPSARLAAIAALAHLGDARALRRLASGSGFAASDAERLAAREALERARRRWLDPRPAKESAPPRGR